MSRVCVKHAQSKTSIVVKQHQQENPLPTIAIESCIMGQNLPTPKTILVTSNQHKSLTNGTHATNQNNTATMSSKHFLQHILIVISSSLSSEQCRRPILHYYADPHQRVCAAPQHLRALEQHLASSIMLHTTCPLHKEAQATNTVSKGALGSLNSNVALFLQL